MLLIGPTVVEVISEAPFSLGCREGHYSFNCFALLTIDTYLIMLSIKQSRHQVPTFESFPGLDLGFNPSLPDR